MKYVTIARLIVGKRHCRVLTVGNIKSSCTGIYITHQTKETGFLPFLRAVRKYSGKKPGF